MCKHLEVNGKPVNCPLSPIHGGHCGHRKAILTDLNLAHVVRETPVVNGDSLPVQPKFRTLGNASASQSPISITKAAIVPAI